MEYCRTRWLYDFRGCFCNSFGNGRWYISYSKSLYLYSLTFFLSLEPLNTEPEVFRDLNSLGGLIKKMPVTFIGGLVGIFGLIGLPLTNGFVSKWLIYKTLILGNRPFLAFAAFLGTWGTVLYGYKFIHNIFLGQLPEKYKNIKEVPFTMRIPIIILTILVFLFGILPGIPLKVINAIGISLGFESLDVTLWGIASETGTLNTINIFAAILIVGIIIWLIFKAGRKAPKVDQYDNYAAGSAIPKNKYNYTVDYYYPFTKMISPYLKDIFDLFLHEDCKHSTETLQ